MSRFIAIKLDIFSPQFHTKAMATSVKSTAKLHRVMGRVRQRIERGGEHLWRFEDFRDLPFSAVAQALSRLTREGSIERLRKASITGIAKQRSGKANRIRRRFVTWRHIERHCFHPAWRLPTSSDLQPKCRDRMRLPPALLAYPGS